MGQSCKLVTIRKERIEYKILKEESALTSYIRNCRPSVKPYVLPKTHTAGRSIRRRNLPVIATCLTKICCQECLTMASEVEGCEDGSLCFCEKPETSTTYRRKKDNKSDDLPVGKGKNSNSSFSTPVTNHRKRRKTKVKSRNVKKQRVKSDSASKDERKEEVEDIFNMSLPTPKSTSLLETADSEGSDSDSDDDFPVGLTPVEYSNVFQEKDLVWIKWRKWPYLPGIIKHVYKRKKRVTVYLFYPKDEPVKPFTVHVGNNNIFSYFDPRRTEIMSSSKDLPKDDLQYFKACVQRAEEFLMKKALKEFEDDWSFFVDIDEALLEEVKNEMKSITGEQREDPVADNRLESDAESEQGPATELRGLSKKGLLRKEKLKEKTKELTEFLLSGTCKEYLFKIFKKEAKSDLHQTFMEGSAKERRNLKHKGFGPIDDEDQIDKVLWTYHSWLGEVNQSPYLHKNDYVFDVWVPEAIVYGLRKLNRYSIKRAWEKFYKGVKCTKEELQLFCDEFLRQPTDLKTEEKITFKPKKLILK